MITPQQYYENSENHGSYQYVTLENIINNFILMYIGDNKLLNNISRANVIYHAKRGLQELNYNALKEVKVLRIAVDDTLSTILPHDYVNYVRVSWIDDLGRFHPMLMDTQTAIAKAYLLDNENKILFDSNGYPLEASPEYVNENGTNNDLTAILRDGYSADLGQNFGIDTSTANINGKFNIDKRLGRIYFSSGIPTDRLVLEYISDGLEYSDESKISINKLAESAIMNYILWQLLNSQINIPEYVIRRARNEYFASRKQPIFASLRINELAQLLKGQQNWLK